MFLKFKSKSLEASVNKTLSWGLLGPEIVGTTVDISNLRVSVKTISSLTHSPCSCAQEQGLWVSDDIVFTDTLKLDMSTVVPTISGPKRPQDKVLLTEASKDFDLNFKNITKRETFSTSKVDGTDYEIKDGSILIAAITSCMKLLRLLK